MLMQIKKIVTAAKRKVPTNNGNQDKEIAEFDTQISMFSPHRNSTINFLPAGSNSFN